MNAIGVILLIGLLYCVVFLPRRGAGLALVVSVLYLPVVQSVSILGFSMHAIRFVELAAFVRVLYRNEFSFRFVNKVDKALIYLYSFTLIVFLLRQDAEEGLFVRVAKTVDVFTFYFAFRGLMQELDDFKWLLGGLVVALIPYVSLLMVERFVDQSVFGVLGVTREAAWIRDGRLRCFGTFRHPSILGSLGATFLPLFVALFWDSRTRRQGLVGVCLATLIVIASNSGGPLSSWVFAWVAWVSWIFRSRMHTLRWVMVVTLVILASLMNSPVYYVLARVSSLTGGTGWHRAYLIEVAIKNFNEWALAGMRLTDTGDWFPYHLANGAADITNQFISFGIQAGLGAVVLFCYLLYRAFQTVGASFARLGCGNDARTSCVVVWGLGITVAVHVVNWQGIPYFDQFNALWMLHLAVISSLSGVPQCGQGVQSRT